jgi:hypothetical protein
VVFKPLTGTSETILHSKSFLEVKLVLLLYAPYLILMSCVGVCEPQIDYLNIFYNAKCLIIRTLIAFKVMYCFLSRIMIGVIGTN